MRGARRTWSVRRSAAHAPQRRRWAFFSSLLELVKNRELRLTPDRSPGKCGRLKCPLAIASGSDCFPGASPEQNAGFRWLASPP